MYQRHASIRSILLFTVGSLTLLIAVITLREVIEQWQRLSNIRTLKAATYVSERYFDILENASREREITYALLKAPNDARLGSLRSQLESNRQKTDITRQHIERSRSQFHLADMHYVAPPDMAALRKKVDQALALPLALRDHALPEHWFDRSSASIMQYYNDWMGFTQHFTHIDPIVTQRMMFQHFLGLIIRYSGKERALIGGMIIAEQPIDSVNQARLLQWRGVIEQGWEMCARLSERSELPPAITPYLRDAESNYLAVYDMVEQLFYIPGAPPITAYPIDSEQWLELANGSTGTLITLKNAAMLQTRTYVESLERDARYHIIGHTLVLIIALLLCAYSFYIITRRVIGPIRQIVGALLAAMHGNAPVQPITSYRSDEIGKLVQVLQAFQYNIALVRSATVEIERGEKKLRAVVDNVLDGLVSIDCHGIIESFNPACERIFGYAAAEVIGQNVKILMPKPYHSEHDGYLHRHLTTGEARIIGTAGREVSGKRKDGSIFPIDLSISRFTMEDGVHFSGIIRDISARKQVEEKLQRYMRDLERSNKELDDFAYIASHDLKEPLRGLHNHSRFLLEDNEGKLGKESDDRLHRLLYLTQRMEKLVNDLLYFSRLGRQELAIQPTDLNLLVHDIIDMIELLLKERHAKILVPLPLPIITCDKTRVTEIFRNLIINAIKYNDKPEKIVELGFLPEHRATDSIRHRNVLYVKDNGLGISPEFHAEIFRIFKRLQNSSAPEEGTGVGLTFVKKIIERHGGKIWLESVPGQGTIFYFTLGSVSNEPESTA